MGGGGAGEGRSFSLIAGVLLALLSLPASRRPRQRARERPKKSRSGRPRQPRPCPSFLNLETPVARSGDPARERGGPGQFLNQKEFPAAVQASDDPAEWNAPETFAAVYMKMLPEKERRRRLARLGAGPKWSEARIEAVDIYNAAIRLHLGTRRRILAAREETEAVSRALRREFPEVAALIVRSAREELTNQGGGIQADYLAGGSYSCVFDLSSLRARSTCAASSLLGTSSSAQPGRPRYTTPPSGKSG